MLARTAGGGFAATLPPQAKAASIKLRAAGSVAALAIRSADHLLVARGLWLVEERGERFRRRFFNCRREASRRQTGEVILGFGLFEYRLEVATPLRLRWTFNGNRRIGFGRLFYLVFGGNVGEHPSLLRGSEGLQGGDAG